MKLKEQLISINTLYAASLACLIKTLIGIYALLSVFVAIPFIQVIWGKEAVVNYLNAISLHNLQAIPLVIIGTIFILICAILMLFAAKQIKKDKRVFLWSITALITAFLILHFGDSQITTVASLLGIIGAISGLIYRGTK